LVSAEIVIGHNIDGMTEGRWPEYSALLRRYYDDKYPYGVIKEDREILKKLWFFCR
jgi:hypothetical protein